MVNWRDGSGQGTLVRKSRDYSVRWGLFSCARHRRRAARQEPTNDKNRGKSTGRDEGDDERRTRAELQPCDAKESPRSRPAEERKGQRVAGCEAGRAGEGFGELCEAARSEQREGWTYRYELTARTMRIGRAVVAQEAKMSTVIPVGGLRKMSEVAQEQAQRKREAFWWMMYVRTGTEGCGARREADGTSLSCCTGSRQGREKRLCSGSKGKEQNGVQSKPTNSIS
ncbi:uncharacterized protein TRIVIDRAFT_63032 [Trichoderma virens Gv29-8]|uniref:Uncharacterized protein n=1 Tax=Hypocrea virens (strain Gv29-8 / FGSC 10586) TaxID=413071 RepID=G9MDX3_HYPVG|nr:uncharacterized protein TRIVIDRAFT_63032 [Trichoderma virens Gv29-8]EHK27270.1 hypothetical protein TRIVIDRAFT_63032 [Trichoderma virens Gv29-8]UKZ57728.1 hypothetical protein TrVGV298_011588 [Trichoderma virens]